MKTERRSPFLVLTPIGNRKCSHCRSSLILEAEDAKFAFYERYSNLGAFKFVCPECTKENLWYVTEKELEKMYKQ